MTNEGGDRLTGGQGLALSLRQARVRYEEGGVEGIFGRLEVMAPILPPTLTLDPVGSQLLYRRSEHPFNFGFSKCESPRRSVP